MRTLMLLAALAGAACAPITAPAGPGPAGEPSTIVQAPAENEGDCARQGGSWRPICLMGKPACVVTFADAGRACTDGSQCASKQCIAQTKAAPDAPAAGICTSTSDPCGCKQFIQNGKAGYPLCID